MLVLTLPFFEPEYHFETDLGLSKLTLTLLFQHIEPQGKRDYAIGNFLECIIFLWYISLYTESTCAT